jgi:hypothetical protein
MLLIYGNDTTWAALSKIGRDEVMRSHDALIKELTDSGELVRCDGLTLEGARTVRPGDGVPVVTDGPFTEGKELLAGFYLVDCATGERAAELASRLPEAPYSPVEVRRIMDEM